MRNEQTNAQLSGMQELRVTANGKATLVSIGIRAVRADTRRSIFIDSEVGSRRSTAEALMNVAADTLYIQTLSGGQVGRALFSGLSSTKEATITIWHGDAMQPQSVRLNVGKLVTTGSFTKSAIEGDAETLRLMDKTAKEQRALEKEVAPVFKKSSQYECFLEATDPQCGKPPRMRWWCIAIFCVPAAGLIGFAFGHCRRGD